MPLLSVFFVGRATNRPFLVGNWAFVPVIRFFKVFKRPVPAFIVATQAHLSDKIGPVCSGKKSPSASHLNMNIAGPMAAFALNVRQARRLLKVHKPCVNSKSCGMATEALGIVSIAFFYNILIGMIVGVLLSTEKKLTMAKAAFDISGVTILT